MNFSIKKSGNSERAYIEHKVRKGNKIISVNIESLGRVDALMAEKGMTREELIAWGKARAAALTEEQKQMVQIQLSAAAQIRKDEQRTFQAGYLFIQKLYYDMHMKTVFRKIKEDRKYEYDLDAIVSDLIYAQILEPGSKRAAYQTAQGFLEPPKYEPHDVYRALSVLAEESDTIQAEIYRNSHLIGRKNSKILYYDCTNYFFEIEEEDGFREYGKSKENRPLPIVQMGLFMDGDGIPLAFDLFHGRQNEQPSLKPLEQKILKEYGFEKFVVCTDSGLASDANRRFNSIQGRAFVTTQSLKKMKQEYRERYLSDTGWRRLSDRSLIADLKEIRQNPQQYTNELYYKEDIYDSGTVLGQSILITYSPKYAVYQKTLRENQVERARKMISSGSCRKSKKNPHDPGRFIQKIAVTEEGELAKEKILDIDEELVEEEASYDGYYALCTNLEYDDVSQILKISERRWEIEESFRIMKSDLKARPIHLSLEDRIRAHFLICYMALFYLRMLEKKLDRKYTMDQLLRTLRSYKLLKLEDYGYLPCYTRTDLTDHLHKVFGFATDTQIVTKSKMRSIIASTKK